MSAPQAAEPRSHSDYFLARSPPFSTNSHAIIPLLVLELLACGGRMRAEEAAGTGATIAASRPAPGVLSDGIYFADASGNPLAQMRLPIISTTLSAADNANTAFIIEVTYTRPESESSPGAATTSATVGSNRFSVVIDGHAFPSTRSGSISRTTTGMGGPSSSSAYTFSLTIPASIYPVAAGELGCTPMLRHHPDYRLAATFTAKQATYTSGGKMMVHVVLTNFDDKRALFMRPNPLQGQWSFMVVNGPAEVATKAQWGRAYNTTVTFPPGGHIDKDVDISESLPLTKPGTYRIRGMLAFTCSPPEDWTPLWDEVLAGDFDVVVTAAAPKP